MNRAEPRLRPIRVAEISITDANFLRALWEQSKQELGLLLVGSLVVSALLFPVMVLLVLEWRWAAFLWGATVAPTALAGYSYLLGRNSAGYTPRLTDLMSAARVYARRAVWTCLPLTIVTVTTAISLPALNLSPPWPVVAAVTANCALVFLATLVTIYALPLLVLFDLQPRHAWRTAALLVARWPYLAFGLAAWLFLLARAGQWLGPGVAATIPFLFMQIAVNTTMMLAKRTASATSSIRTSSRQAGRPPRLSPPFAPKKGDSLFGCNE